MTDAQTATVAGNFTIARTGNGTINSYGGKILVSGNVICGDGANGGTTDLQVVGSGASHTYTMSGGGVLPPLTFNGVGGSFSPAVGTTTYLSQGLTITNGTFTAPTGTMGIYSGDFNFTGGSFVHNNGLLLFDRFSSCVGVSSNFNVPSGISLYSLTIGSQTGCSPPFNLTIGAAQTVTVNGDLSIARTGNGTIDVSSGTLQVYKNVSVGAGVTGGTTNIVFAGGAVQSLSQSGGGVIPGSGLFINKSAGSVSLATAVAMASGKNVTFQSNSTLLMNGLNFTGINALTMTVGSVLTAGGGTLGYTLWNGVGTINP